MGSVSSFFDINNTFFSILGYHMSYLEFFGTLLNLWSVWLVTKNNVLTWPVGNIAVVLFGVLFYQIHLYSDLCEQVYFFITGLYGWWIWLFISKNHTGKIDDLAVTHTSSKERNIYMIVIILGTAVMSFVVGNIHLWLPHFFPQKASFIFLDAFTTVMSFAATILMAHKKLECWYLWIAVDVIDMPLYCAKGVFFVAVLYFIFLVLASRGLFNWKKIVTV